MNYKLITDLDALNNFIKWLPDLKDNEQYYLSLFARKKYCNDLIKSSDKTQLKRFTANKENMLNKIRQLELPLNTWKLKDTAAPQESLVIYILPNPRCMKKATAFMGKKCWDLSKSNNYNLATEAMSCIQKSKSRSEFVHFDIDTDKVIDFKQALSKIIPIINYNPAFDVIQTRGGYHLLIKPSRAIQSIKIYNGQMGTNYTENWFPEIMKNLPIEQSGDMMTPIPGTYQGGFTPSFMEYN